MITSLISGIGLTRAYIPWRSTECGSPRVVNDRHSFICGIHGIVPDAGNTAACQRGFAVQVMILVLMYVPILCTYYHGKFSLPLTPARIKIHDAVTDYSNLSSGQAPSLSWSHCVFHGTACPTSAKADRYRR